jgi:hypothetical protein
VAVKLAEIAPAATVTDAGTVSSELLELNATLDPPAGAAALSVTVHAPAAPDARLVGLHFTADTVASVAVNAIEADCELLLSVAVTLAL